MAASTDMAWETGTFGGGRVARAKEFKGTPELSVVFLVFEDRRAGAKYATSGFNCWFPESSANGRLPIADISSADIRIHMKKQCE